MVNMDQMLQKATAELAELDTFLSKTLEYTAQVDESFKSISIRFGEFKEKALEFIDDNKKDFFTNSKEADKKMQELALLSEGLELGIRGVGELYKYYKQQQALGKLLKIKQDIATEKYKAVESVLQRSAKNVFRFEDLVKLYANQSYQVNKINDCASQKRQMASLMNQYRMSYYIYLSLSYLIAEYDAWLNGQHDPEEQSPNLLDVNKQIINHVLFPNASSADIRIEFEEAEKEKPVITGRLLFLLVDDGLLAFYLAYNDKLIYWAERFYLGYFQNDKIVSLLNDNIAFQDSLSAYEEYRKILDKGDGATKIYVVSALFAVAIVVGSLYCEETWVKITLMLVGLFIVINAMMKRKKKAKLKFKDALNTILFQIRNKMLVRAGDAPRKQKVSDMTNGSPVWGAIIGAILGFFFIPFPGGLLLGLFIGAYFGGSSD